MTTNQSVILSLTPQRHEGAPNPAATLRPWGPCWQTSTAKSGRNVRPLVQFLIRGLQVGILPQAYRPAGAGAGSGSVLTTPLGASHPSPIEQSYFCGGPALVSIQDSTTYACIFMLHENPGAPPVMCVIWHNYRVSRKIVLHISISEAKSEEDVSLLSSQPPSQPLL